MFFSLFLIKIKVSVTLDVDVLKNKGNICIRIFGIIVFKRNARLEFNDKVKLKLCKEKTKCLQKQQYAKPKRRKSKRVFLSKFLYLIIERAIIPKLHVVLEFGINEDAFLAALSFGSITVALDSGLAFLSTRIYTNITTDYKVNFERTVFKVMMDSNVNIRIADIFSGLFRAILHKINNSRIKNKKNKKLGNRINGFFKLKQI